jgi:hypothetical protein
MIEGIRNGILSAESACTDDEEDFSGEDRDADSAQVAILRIAVSAEKFSDNFLSSKNNVKTPSCTF